MKYTYIPSGVCSKKIEFELEDDIIKEVRFYGGCNGNATGISRLVNGMKAKDVISKLKGTKCGNRNTSCPDQLAIAIEKAIKENT